MCHRAAARAALRRRASGTIYVAILMLLRVQHMVGSSSECAASPGGGSGRGSGGASPSAPRHARVLPAAHQPGRLSLQRRLARRIVRESWRAFVL